MAIATVLGHFKFRFTVNEKIVSKFVLESPSPPILCSITGLVASDTGSIETGHSCHLDPMGWSFAKNRHKASAELFRH